MKTRLLAAVKTGIATVLLVSTTMYAPLSRVYATHVMPTGNNGTLKVHEIGTPTGTENNDPKVCAFNFEGFGFDAGQSGYVMITTQGGSQPVGQDAGPFTFGPVNASGYAISQDFNTTGGTAVVNGTYKATLYGKDTGGNVDLQDEKAKSKVFKVNCEVEDTSVTPTAPSMVDLACDEDGSFTIPNQTGVMYKVNGATSAAGDYFVDSPRAIEITAEAAPGYVLEGQVSWEFMFHSPEECEGTPPVEDVCLNIDGVQTQVPDTMQKDNDGNCIVPGRGAGVPPVTPPVAEVSASVLQTPTPLTATPVAGQLANTGVSPLGNTLVSLAIIGLATGATMLRRKDANRVALATQGPASDK